MTQENQRGQLLIFSKTKEKPTNSTINKLKFQKLKKTASIVKKNWDDQLKIIKEAIQQQEATLEKYMKEDLSGIRTNLFVKSEYANVVETKLNELGKHLASLRLELDKLKDHYENVGTNNETTSQ